MGYKFKKLKSDFRIGENGQGSDSKSKAMPQQSIPLVFKAKLKLFLTPGG